MKSPLLALAAALTLSATLSAQLAPNPAANTSNSRPAPRMMDSSTRSNFLARSGGFIPVPSTGPTLLFLNTQTRVAPAEVQETSEQIKKVLSLPIVFRNQPSSAPVADAVNALADTKTAAVIVIGDSAGYPSLLIAPENRWAFVNVAALNGPNVSAATLAERVQKEMWRAFGYLMGAAHSNFEPCLLKPVLAPDDLDALKPKTLCPEPFGKIMAQAKRLGLQPARMTTYRKAVEEGWAPEPTTDSQRAIWNELRK
jgi:hypothetical protein